MTMAKPLDMLQFKLGTPALVCRWRLSQRTLVLENRHLRALGARRVNGQRVDPSLVAWARQHIEWTLDGGAAQHPDGVLMLVIDEKGQAAMTVGPFEPLAKTSLEDLMERSANAHVEAETTGVSPETLWVVQDNILYCDDEPATTAAGATSLIEGLAYTLGMPVRRDPKLRDAIQAGSLRFEEAFLVSDEYGVVPASDCSARRAERFSGAYERLLNNPRTR
jgi:hypothetical protein